MLPPLCRPAPHRAPNNPALPIFRERPVTRRIYLYPLRPPQPPDSRAQSDAQRRLAAHRIDANSKPSSAPLRESSRGWNTAPLSLLLPPPIPLIQRRIPVALKQSDTYWGHPYSDAVPAPHRGG